jgi:hypothetical protein
MIFEDIDQHRGWLKGNNTSIAAHVPSCFQRKPPVMRADIEKGTALRKVLQNPLANVRLRVSHIDGQHSWMHPKEFAANLSRDRRPWNRRKPPLLCAHLHPAVKPLQRPFQSAIKVDPHVYLVPVAIGQNDDLPIKPSPMRTRIIVSGFSLVTGVFLRSRREARGEKQFHVFCEDYGAMRRPQSTPAAYRGTRLR